MPATVPANFQHCRLLHVGRRFSQQAGLLAPRLIVNVRGDLRWFAGQFHAAAGMAAPLPRRQNSLPEFSIGLHSCVECLSAFDRWPVARRRRRPRFMGAPRYVKTASGLDRIDLLDASFFDLDPGDAVIANPQVRRWNRIPSLWLSPGSIPSIWECSIWRAAMWSVEWRLRPICGRPSSIARILFRNRARRFHRTGTVRIMPLA